MHDVHVNTLYRQTYIVTSTLRARAEEGHFFSFDATAAY